MDGKYIRCTNVAENKLSNFRITLAELQTFASPVQAIVHSHPSVQPYPSFNDMEQQILGDIPWAIASVTANEDGSDPYCMDLFWFGDSLPRLPLVGRAFRHGVQDCFALARDEHKTRGIDVPNFPRSNGWWVPDKNKPTRRLFEEYFEESGFEIIDVSQIREGDGFACPYATSVICHCGVFMPGEKVLHHFANSKSEIVAAHKWVRRTMDGGKFFRWKG